MPQKPHRALVLSGGGAKGVYEVGCLQRILQDGPGLDFDYFLGISAGSLNAAFLAGAAPGHDGLKSRLAALHDIWDQEIQGTADVYRGNLVASKLDLVQIGLGKDSLLDATPIRRLIDRYLGNAPVQRRLHVGTTSLEKGAYVAFEFAPGLAPTSMSLARAVKASTAVPALFSPVQWSDDWLVDGAIRDNTPLGHAFAADPDEIVVIQTSPVDGGLAHQNFDMKGGTGIKGLLSGGDGALDVLLRSARIMADEVQKDDINGAKQWNLVLQFIDEVERSARQTNDQVMLDRIDTLRKSISRKDPNGNVIPRRFVKLRVYAPQKPLLDDELDFKKKDLLEMYRLGFEDGKAPVWVVD